MKTSTILILLLSVLYSCSSEEEEVQFQSNSCHSSEEYFEEGKGASITITDQTWTIKENASKGIDTFVSIRGSITGDSIKIFTFGDGLFAYCKLHLNGQNEFNETIGLSFVHGEASPPLDKYYTLKTDLLIFKNTDTLKVDLTSCEIESLDIAE